MAMLNNQRVTYSPKENDRSIIKYPSLPQKMMFCSCSDGRVRGQSPAIRRMGKGRVKVEKKATKTIQKLTGAKRRE